MSADDPTPDAVPRSFLVCLAGEVPACEVRYRADALVARHGGTVMTVLETLPGFGVRATDQQALAYTTDSGVGAVERSRRVVP